ncbi:WD repeat-containing protein 25 [Ananas comosus]|uniref:WD repeat-containing protein 25 n=1 Tax=Ananas comosus TaxID=4615 RepID=A0A199VQ43_ANACO|nr:WD repeat-containing protein 25 [Ananas comosus]
MDQAVHIWNVWNTKQPKARIFNYHKAAVKDVRWTPNGLSLLSCGFDCSSRVVDVEKGEETNIFKEDQVVEVIKFHPNDPNLFLSGGSKGFLRLWDIRMGKMVKEYQRSLGAILDIEFSADGKHFISSSDTSKSNISENCIIIWDVVRQVPLSNQVYTEAYTCPCVRYHPTDASFVAQSNGNYIAIFSARPPFKLDRYRRYEGHGVWGFPIKCNFSLDGRELTSGSSDGSIYLYDYKTARLLRKLKAFNEACIDVVYHPVKPNVIASCSWNGEVSVFE